MDPNANLREQESILLVLKDTGRTDYVRLRELRSALRTWLRSGGFAPEWKRYPAAAQQYAEWAFRQHGYTLRSVR